MPIDIIIRKRRCDVLKLKKCGENERIIEQTPTQVKVAKSAKSTDDLSGLKVHPDV